MGERYSHLAVLLYCLVFLPSLSGQSLENSISLVCEPAFFIVNIPLELFEDGADENNIDMGGCPGTGVNDGYIILKSNYNSCGTTLDVDSAEQPKLVYSNTVTNAVGGLVTTDQAIRINVECAFDQNNLVSSSALVQNTLVKPVTSDGEYSISFGVYSDDGYLKPITGEDIVSTDSDIFLKAQVNNIVGLDVFPTKCYATPTSDADDTTFYELINAGISESQYATHLRDADIDDKPTFSFASKVFRFSRDSGQTIYIHCNLKICPDDTCPLPSTARGRRSARSSQLTVSRHVSAGPIRIRQTREAEMESGWQSTALTVYSATLSVFVVCTIGVVAMVQYRRRTTKIDQQV